MHQAVWEDDDLGGILVALREREDFAASLRRYLRVHGNSRLFTTIHILTVFVFGVGVDRKGFVDVHFCLCFTCGCVS